MFKKKPLDDIKEVLLRGTSEETDLNKLKAIFKENELLRQVPPAQRTEFCVAMRLHILSPFEVFLTEKVKKPELYIILDGKILIRNKAREEQILQNYEIFGYTTPFDNKKWQPSRVVAHELVSLISIPRAPVKSAMKKVKKLQENIKLLEILVKTVPGVRQLGQAGKEKVLSFFERCEFSSGEVLLREGQRAAHAYIIEQGECNIVMSENPLSRPGSAPTRGLISKTTSCFNLGVITPGEWVGEDSILLSKPLTFSAIAANALSALRITKENFLINLSKDTQAVLKENLISKNKWREQRKANIANAMLESVNDEEGKAEVAYYADAGKFYPKATNAALVNIRKQELADSLDSGYVRQSYEKLKIVPSSARKVRFREDFSHSSKSVLRSQSFLKKNFAEHSEATESKIKLNSAYTLGCSLIPTIIKRPQSANRLQQPLQQPVILKAPKPQPILPSPPQETFAQRVRQPRPASPNPVDLWAKRKGLDLNHF